MSGHAAGGRLCLRRIWPPGGTPLTCEGGVPEGAGEKDLGRTKEAPALHPDQFRANEAWIAFQLNETPIGAGRDGSFNCFALMDAASCFILALELVAVHEPEPPPLAMKRLLRVGREHKNQLPARLLVPEDGFAEALPAEAARAGIPVVRVPESELLVFIGEARRDVSKRFGRKRRR